MLGDIEIGAISYKSVDNSPRSMGDALATDTESNKNSPRSEEPSETDRRPFGGLEFQVSEVVGRLEAGVNAQETGDDEKRREPRKISAGFFEPEETSMDELLKVLENLVLKTDPSCETLEPPLLPTDAVTRAAILSHSISALFERLERNHAARLGAHIATETSRWMAHMFRVAEYEASYHGEPLEGLVRVARALLLARYPRYLDDGALALSARPPTLYVSAHAPGAAQLLCRRLALPLHTVRAVPADGRGMDVGALEELCAADEAAGAAPLLLLAHAGAGSTGAGLGGGERLAALRALCARRRLHLHLRGHALALPAALRLAPHETYSIADSLTLTPGPWFGVPGLPNVTFYKIPETVTANDHSQDENSEGSADSAPAAATSTAARWGALAALSGLGGAGGPGGATPRLAALPLWAALQAGGARGLRGRLRLAFRAARRAREIIADADLAVLSEPPGDDESPNVDIVEAVSVASACVAFQLAPPDAAHGSHSPHSPHGSHSSLKPPPYYDKLNSWLGQVLQREADMISIEVCETERHGVVLRYCPLETGVVGVAEGEGEGESEAEGAARLRALLQAQVAVLRATLQLREPFAREVARHPDLRLVAVPGWAGLGGVRYCPPQHAPAALDALNRQLVERLRVTDGAFSCGEAEDGGACVRFGMVTADTDVLELLQLLLLAARQLEDSERALTDMTEVLKKGISEAQAELERESAQRLWQEGLLRRVPVVGRVVSWWGAPPAAPPAPGLRLHLAHGTLQPTTDVYRYVQKQPEAAPEPAPAPEPRP